MRNLSISPALAVIAGLASMQPALAQTASQQLQAKRQEALLDIANTNVVGIIGGAQTSTRTRMILDMRNVLNVKDKLRIVPIVGQTATQNVIDLFFLRGVDVAVVQADVLSSLKAGTSIPRLRKQIRYIAPLHDETLHMVVGSGISNIRQLAGRIVNFSSESTGTVFTASNILSQLGIKVRAIRTSDGEGLRLVKSGEISATVRLDGRMSSAFGDLALTDKLRLLEVPMPQGASRVYRTTRLTSAGYPGLIPRGQSVDSVTVSMVMVSRNWPRRSLQFKKIAKFARSLNQNLARFRERQRDPKWEQVRLDRNVPGWSRFDQGDDGTETQLATTPTLSATNADVVGARVTEPPTVDEIFSEFKKWSNENRQ